GNKKRKITWREHCFYHIHHPRTHHNICFLFFECQNMSSLSCYYQNVRLFSLSKNAAEALSDETGHQTSVQSNDIRLPANTSENRQKKRLDYKKTSRAKNKIQYSLSNVSTAENIAKYLTDSLNEDTHIVEANPGRGFLTELLIENGLKHLHMFEGNRDYAIHLEESYSKVYPKRVKLKKFDIFSLGGVRFVDAVSGSRKMDELLADLPITKWQNGINFRLFGITQSTQFFNELISSIVYQNGILSLGRCELYIMLPPLLYMIFTSSAEASSFYYRPHSMLFQVFFEYELLDKFSRADIEPSVAKYSKLSRRSEILRKTDPESMYFMKIIPRKDLYQFFTTTQIQEFWHFIRRSCRSRATPVIPHLESIIPSCGGYLLLNFNTKPSVTPTPIRINNSCQAPPFTNPSMTLSNEDFYNKLNTFTKFGDLQPSELLTLFYEFSNLPDYAT
ncbi:Dimethyladenosine transferase 2, mitochondrial, partial [Pseudolycoriella hygida]